MPTAHSSRKKYERYSLSQSPFAQRPTQKDVAKLLRVTRDDLRRLVNYKEQFIVRRTIETGTKVKKIRQLAYPTGQLRAAHELLRFHLNKVRQPSYLFSPRKGKSQRDNAELHLAQDQFLSFDLKQFYPSTSASMVRSWLIDELLMYTDVASLITKLVTVDDAVSFGSPLTPVLCTLIHRKMFDEIADLCDARHLCHSVWVDDVTISGRFVPGEFFKAVREIVRQHGLKTHKIKFQSGSRPVFVTGIGVLGSKLITPRKFNEELKKLFSEYHESQTLEEKEDCGQKLLSRLGTARFISGKESKRGRKAADQMNSIKQELAELRKADKLKQTTRTTFQSEINSVVPFDL